MTVVAVTGASGYLGRCVLETLDASEEVRRVIGIDVAEPGFSTRNLEFYRLDVRSPAVREAISGADAIVHLASATSPRGDAEEAHDIDVGGTRSMLAAAAEARVRKFVYVSSATAYGAHPDNDFPLTEESPLRPVRGFPPSAHKGECEEMIREFQESHPEVVVTVLRPGATCGPTVSGVMARAVESPYLLGVAGYDPPVQALHEADAARAVVFALERDLNGAYNVCPNGWISLKESARLLEQRLLVLSYDEAYRRADRLWRVGLADCSPSSLPFRMYPWVMSNERLEDAGFRCLHSSEEALLAAAEARRGWVSVGRFRFRGRNVALGLAGSALVGASLLRRHRGAKARR